MFACEGEVCSSVSNEHFNIFLVKINFVNFKNRLMVVQIGLGVGGLMFFVQLRCRSQHHLTRNVALFFAVQEKKLYTVLETMILSWCMARLLRLK